MSKKISVVAAMAFLVGTAAVAQAELVRLERETEARRNLYQTLIERAEQTAISPRALEQEPSARVVSPAVAPTRKGFGSRLLRMGLVGTGGSDVRYLPTGLEATFRAPRNQVELAG